jgi:hypothetical protein
VLVSFEAKGLEAKTTGTGKAEYQATTAEKLKNISGGEIQFMQGTIGLARNVEKNVEVKISPLIISNLGINIPS